MTASAFVNNILVLLKITVLGRPGLRRRHRDRSRQLGAARTAERGRLRVRLAGCHAGRVAAVLRVHRLRDRLDRSRRGAQSATRPADRHPWIAGACTVIYIAVAAVLTGVVPYRELGVPDPIAARDRPHGHAGARRASSRWAHCAGLTSVLLVNAFGQSRVAFAMSRDGLLPPLFSRLGERVRTPSAGIVVFGVISAVGAALLPLVPAGRPDQHRHFAGFRHRLPHRDLAAQHASRPRAPVSRAVGWLPDRAALVRLGAGRRHAALCRHGGARGDRYRGAGRCAARCCRS